MEVPNKHLVSHSIRQVMGIYIKQKMTCFLGIRVWLGGNVSKVEAISLLPLGHFHDIMGFVATDNLQYHNMIKFHHRHYQSFPDFR